MQNVKFHGHSNIYKVMGNILIEKLEQTHYSNIVNGGFSQHKTTIIMEE